MEAMIPVTAGDLSHAAGARVDPDARGGNNRGLARWPRHRSDESASRRLARLH